MNLPGNERLSCSPLSSSWWRKLYMLSSCALSAMILSCTLAFAQVEGAAGDMATPIPGAGHHYIGLNSDVLSETVNPATGSVSVSINVPTPPSRGFTLPLSIRYSSAGVNQLQYSNPGGIGPVGNEYWSTGAATDAGVGWSYSIPLLTLWSDIGANTNISETDAPFEEWPCDFFANYVFQDLAGERHDLMLSPGQTGCPLGAPITGGYTTGGDVDGEYLAETSNFPGGGAVNEPVIAIPNVPAIVKGFDGMVYTFNNFWPANTPNQLPGTEPFISYPSTIEDRNGNLATILYTLGSTVQNIQYPGGISYTDTNGRNSISIGPVNPSTNANTISVPGINSVTLQWGYQNATFQGAGSTLYQFPGQGTGCNPAQMPAYTVPGVSRGVGEMIQTITLPGVPNPQTFTFSYDSETGLLYKIKYPSGAFIQYTWGPDPDSEVVYGLTGNYPTGTGVGGVNISFLETSDSIEIFIPPGPSDNGTPETTLICNMTYGTPAIVARDVSYDGVNIAQHQDFTYYTNWPPPSLTGCCVYYWNYKTTTVTTTDRVGKSGQSMVTYTYEPIIADHGWQNPNLPSGPVWPMAPVESSVSVKDASGNVLQTTTENWFDQYEKQCSLMTTNSGETSGDFYSYGPAMQVADQQEFGYGQLTPTACNSTQIGFASAGSGASGSISPIRETKIAYNSFNGLPNRGFLALPSMTRRYGNGTLMSETDIAYDQTAPSSVTAVQHDPNYNLASGGSLSHSNYRGNQTTVAKRCWPSCSDATVHYTWDTTGQITSFTDALGNVTNFLHQDNPASGPSSSICTPTSNAGTNAYLTCIDPPHVNSVSHATTYQYDYPSGDLRVSTDPNGQQTQYRYVDPINRLTETDSPDGGKTTITYNDSGENPSIATSALMNNSGTSKIATTIMDGIGHSIQTQLTDPEGTDYTDTAYDGFGRVYTASNAYRNKSDPWYGVTTYTYDTLGRTVIRQNADGVSKEQWCYDGLGTAGQTNCHSRIAGNAGEWVDFADENLNDWQHISDAFGNLARVMEPNGISVPQSGVNAPPSLETDYSYDALNNLTSVTQWGGTSGSPATNGPIYRSFTYNSLSQLVTATNPETGAICYGKWSGSHCQGGYDANGNLLYKTDARSITIGFAYDGLNRLSNKTYSNDPSKTPSVCYQYDLSPFSSPQTNANWVGRMTNQWTQSASQGACSASAPATGFWAMRSLLSYDPMGRVWNEKQCTPSGCRSANSCPSPSGTSSTSYSYDLAGNLTCSTNGIPSTPGAGNQALTFSNSLDAAGRLQTVTSSWTDATHPVTLFSAQPGSTLPCPTSLSAQYTAFGALMNATSGNGIALNRGFDNRLRTLCEIDSGLIVTNGTSGSATVTVTGAEQSK